MVSQYNIGGRFQSDDYSPFTYDEMTIGSVQARTIMLPGASSNPMLKGVSNFPYYYTSNVFAVRALRETPPPSLSVACALVARMACGKLARAADLTHVSLVRRAGKQRQCAHDPGPRHYHRSGTTTTHPSNLRCSAPRIPDADGALVLCEPCSRMCFWR